MDLDSIEGLNEIRLSVYRVSMKLLSLQKLCHMDAVSLRHITAAFHSVSGAGLQQEAVLNREEVIRTLNRMFHNMSQEVPGHVTAGAPEETCSLMFRLYERNQTGCVSAASFQTALIALSAETLLLKYRALVSVAQNSSGSVSRSGLRLLLQDLSQVPAAVQEEGIFGDVDVAVKLCFNGVLTSTAGEEHVLSWLQSEPRLVLWLPTLYRLSISQNIIHSIRCHICKTHPIIGLRYRCMKCVNTHVCQGCFLTARQTRKHKTHHPVLEFCTQTSWRESLTSLVHMTRHALLPQRYTQREADKRRVLMWEEPRETENSASLTTNPSTQMAAPAVNHSTSSGRAVSHDASIQSPPCSFSSKSLQTDMETQPQQLKTSALLTEVRNLQRDKWLLEQQLQAWRLTVQSEQGILEDRCTEMEVTMEMLREHNVCMQGLLTQAVNKMEALQHANNIPHRENIEHMDTGNGTMPTPDTVRNKDEGQEEEEEGGELLKTEDKWSDDEETQETPTMHQDAPQSHDFHCEEEEESAGDICFCLPVGQQDGPEAAGPQEESTGLSEEEDCGTYCPEKLLQETVEKLKSVMETDRWRKRQKGERKGAELLEAAVQLGDSLHHLVDALKTKH